MCRLTVWFYANVVYVLIQKHIIFQLIITGRWNGITNLSMVLLRLLGTNDNKSLKLGFFVKIRIRNAAAIMDSSCHIFISIFYGLMPSKSDIFSCFNLSFQPCERRRSQNWGTKYFVLRVLPPHLYPRPNWTLLYILLRSPFVQSNLHFEQSVFEDDWPTSKVSTQVVIVDLFSTKFQMKF